MSPDRGEGQLVFRLVSRTGQHPRKSGLQGPSTPAPHPARHQYETGGTNLEEPLRSVMEGAVRRRIKGATYFLDRWRRGEGVEPSGNRNGCQAGFEDR